MLQRGTLRGGFATHCSPNCTHPPRCTHLVASMGGRGGFGDPGLILGPNGSPMGRSGAPGGPPNRLIIPGGQGRFSQQQRAPVGLPVDDPSSGPGQLPPAHKYRPPPGFMGDNVQDPALNQTDPQEMISKLRSRAGQWHQLAKLLPVLYAKGLDSNTIAELTGINPNDQNNWIVAGTVYDSIAATGKVEGSVLSCFDSDGFDKLSPFRFLPAERRAAAAQYIVDNNLDPPACEVLARAMKEWDRRRGERTGFDNSPGDCMAFKYLRDAAECRSADEAGEKLSLAFSAAVTDSARERLVDWRDTELAERSGAGSGGGPAGSLKARLTVLRLQQDELGFRPLAQISPLSQATVDELQWAPRTSQEGAFGAFELQAGGQDGAKWVALPQWKALALARHPVAIPLPDCAADAAVLAATRAKTDEEKKKLRGVGLLVVDTEGVTGSIDPDAYYVVAAPPGSSQQLQLMDGTQLLNSNGGSEPVAAVLFLCRPPNRESQITSAELLQL